MLYPQGWEERLTPCLRTPFLPQYQLNLRLDEVSGNTLRGELHEDITNTLTGPQGRVFFYVNYPCIKFCKKWGIPYPCGFKPCQAKKNIVGFTTLSGRTFFCENRPFLEYSMKETCDCHPLRDVKRHEKSNNPCSGCCFCVDFDWFVFLFKDR